MIESEIDTQNFDEFSDEFSDEEEQYLQNENTFQQENENKNKNENENEMERHQPKIFLGHIYKRVKLQTPDTFIGQQLKELQTKSNKTIRKKWN
ncbi:hypothetical protein M0813_16388 [Anaeramoeba flamelloides]|uniref:Uncharacterized protein n=1 Tax=Anaeramoeba flamelloides TaxID=1746091 RepID=A0ABQ8YZR9_9EUKA|nr:hypothetical protein M0813_16388 [Anaeramoeba flamelloides]